MTLPPTHLNADDVPVVSFSKSRFFLPAAVTGLLLSTVTLTACGNSNNSDSAPQPTATITTEPDNPSDENPTSQPNETPSAEVNVATLPDCSLDVKKNTPNLVERNTTGGNKFAVKVPAEWKKSQTPGLDGVYMAGVYKDLATSNPSVVQVGFSVFPVTPPEKAETPNGVTKEPFDAIVTAETLRMLESSGVQPNVEKGTEYVPRVNVDVSCVRIGWQTDDGSFMRGFWFIPVDAAKVELADNVLVATVFVTPSGGKKQYDTKVLVSDPWVEAGQVVGSQPIFQS